MSWLRKVWGWLTSSKARKAVQTASKVLDTVEDMQSKTPTLRVPRVR